MTTEERLKGAGWRNAPREYEMTPYRWTLDGIDWFTEDEALVAVLTSERDEARADLREVDMVLGLVGADRDFRRRMISAESERMRATERARAQAQAKANEIPGLTAELDAARWERDVALGSEPAAGQALAEIARLVRELDDARAERNAERAARAEAGAVGYSLGLAERPAITRVDSAPLLRWILAEMVDSDTDIEAPPWVHRVVDALEAHTKEAVDVPG